MSENILVRIIRSVRPLPLDKSLAQLQDKLYWFDWRHPRNVPGAGTGTRFLLVKRLHAIRIRMDGNKNHKRPHVHIDYGEEYHTASYAIDNGERIAGELHGKYDQEVSAWIVKMQTSAIAGMEANPSWKEC
jgi:hypothetical protein